ncbi:hypothetical protein TWF696_002518 [Orbilia brochopaga]|uniref:Uncharacterized protein n=1 Tax=Orbilia brochopaga TaxID=3140254 RepID=A0AAV9U4D3_9PEZI
MAAIPVPQLLRPQYAHHEGRPEDPAADELVKNVRNQIQSYLHNPRTRTGVSWKPKEREMKLGVGVSPTDVVKLEYAMGQIWERRDSEMIKKEMIEDWNLRDFSVLDSISGLRISACSPIAHRVPLRFVLLDCLDRGVETYEAGALTSLKPAIRALLRSDNREISATWDRFDKDERKETRRLIEFLLTNLLPTGLSGDGKSLKLLWPHEASLKETIRITVAGGDWVEILRGMAIFAVMTHACLGDSPGAHDCHSARRSIANYQLKGVKSSFVKARTKFTFLGLHPSTLPSDTRPSNQLDFEKGHRYILQSGNGYLKSDPSGTVKCFQLPQIWRQTFKLWGQQVTNPQSFIRLLLKLEMIREITTSDELDKHEVVVL